MRSTPKLASQTETTGYLGHTLFIALAVALAVVYGVIADPVTSGPTGGYDAIPVRASTAMANPIPPKQKRPPRLNHGGGQVTLTRIVP